MVKFLFDVPQYSGTGHVFVRVVGASELHLVKPGDVSDIKDGPLGLGGRHDDEVAKVTTRCHGGTGVLIFKS
jgi:hypothetical protein